MTRATRPTCYLCGSAVRSMSEHLTTAKHRARASSVQSSGPKGSHPYRPSFRMPSDAEYAAYLEEQYLASLPPTIDEVFPDELADPTVESAPIVRGHRPEPCDRCGQTFRTPAGRDWHMRRNTRCVKWRPARERLAS